MKRVIYLLFLSLNFDSSAFGSLDEDKNETIDTSPKQVNLMGCSMSFRNLWIAGGVVGGVAVIGGTGMLIRFLNSGDDTSPEPVEPVFPEIKKPDSLNRKIDSIEVSNERIQVEKDAAGYLNSKYGGQEKLAIPLSRFCEAHPVEAREALIAESLMERTDTRSAKAVLEESGTQVHFGLLYAWVITHQFNRPNHTKETTYAEVVSEVEKEILDLWP